MSYRFTCDVPACEALPFRLGTRTYLFVTRRLLFLTDFRLLFLTRRLLFLDDFRLLFLIRRVLLRTVILLTMINENIIVMYSHNLLMNYNIDDKTLQLADQCKLNIACMELSKLPDMLQPDYFPVRPVKYNLVTHNNILTLYEIPEYQPISLKMFQQLSDFKLPNVHGVKEEDMIEVLMLVYRNHPKMIELSEKLGWIRTQTCRTN